MTRDIYLQGLTDANLKQEIYCNRKQERLGITINSDTDTKNRWVAECGAILDNPSGNSDLEAELTKRGIVDDIPTETDLPPVHIVDVNTNKVISAGIRSSNTIMLIIVGGFLYYAYKKGLLNK